MNCQRVFLPGSRWVYFKIYSGAQSLDKILIDKIFQMNLALSDQRVIDKWFFIRYQDPEYHLRIRYLLHNQDQIGHIIHVFHESLNNFMSSDSIWNIQIDTYKREIERYGSKTMELSESLFHADSDTICKFLDLIEGPEGEELRWLFGLRASEDLLSAFGLGIIQKKDLLDQLKTTFGDEFGMNRNLKRQLDLHYRKYRQKIENFMKANYSEYKPIWEVLEERSIRLNKVASEIISLRKKNVLPPLNDLLGSYLHMQMNRLFRSKNRLNEMVSYDYLYRYYSSEIAKRKYAQPKSISA